LKGENATKVWDPESKGEGYPRNHKLILKNCVLGANAAPDEYNVVEVC
jgi:nucleophosmin 3